MLSFCGHYFILLKCESSLGINLLIITFTMECLEAIQGIIPNLGWLKTLNSEFGTKLKNKIIIVYLGLMIWTYNCMCI